MVATLFRTSYILFLFASAATASAQSQEKLERPTNWIGFSLGAGRTRPCANPTCDRFALSGEWFRHLGTSRYVAVRATGLLQVALYDGGGVAPPSNKVGEASALYGVQWWGNWVDARLGTGIAMGEETRVRYGASAERRYVGLPVDAQVGLRLSRLWRLTFTAFGSRGSDFSHMTGVIGIHCGIE